MNIRTLAATALDNTLDAAAAKRGIHTDKARNTLAAFLDGVIRVRASTVRAYVRYLNSVA